MCRRCFICLGLGVLLLAILSVSVLNFGPKGTPQAWKRSSPTPPTPHPATGLTERTTVSPAVAAAYRLTNTPDPISKLARNEHALLLENALLDTALPVNLPIPKPLRAHAEPGAYIVQSRGPAGAGFRAALKARGAELGAYIPNNAFLVTISSDIASQLATDPHVQSVLPYEPYFKLQTALLPLALTEASPQPVPVNLLLFSSARDSAVETIGKLGFQFTSGEQSPFGPVLKLQVAARDLNTLAALPEVQAIELSHQRVPANDLSRVALGITVDCVTSSNYLGLIGSNVLVNLNDTGVDTNQPDLFGRVLVDAPATATDTNGHGTHVAGIIAGSGAQSTNVAFVPGSPVPPHPMQFRGKAPAARLFAAAVNLSSGAPAGDVALQQNAARTNALISNNSWLYAADNSYDLAAASYDAAVRDALPTLSGSQPVLFVFPAGNCGGANDDGTGGIENSVLSPGTAKNVITVGAIELSRRITNQTWSCTAGGQTNTPWLDETDSTNEVAAFSSRGNIAPGLEGPSGRFKPDLVAPGTFVISTRSSQWDQPAYYAQTNNLFTSAPDTNYSVVLSNLNSTLGPFYRFESGTSLAAADVSGTLALMQEFFQQRLRQTNSPALMKALLINGARSLTPSLGFGVSTTNSQGWGLPHLPNSLPLSLTNSPAASSSIFVFDQNPATALGTGESQTLLLSLSQNATNLPLRFTLVWTDPPGNPAAAIKLVNDLDLVVTNLDTGQIYLGNDFPAGSIFNQPRDPNSLPNDDYVNNVENIFLTPGSGRNFSVTVLGRRVAVNAVTDQSDKIAQDYALVISSGDGQVADALTVSNLNIVATTGPLVTLLTNTFTATPDQFGTMLFAQRVGAPNPLPGTNTVPLANLTNAWLNIGSPNKWQFYRSRSLRQPRLTGTHSLLQCRVRSLLPRSQM